jgi:DNA-binding transcriptional regulator YiaG
MLWLLFKTKIGREQRVTVRTLMRIAYGEDKVIQASSQREGRKRLLRTFESDLEVLNRYGLKPIFDPVTYPPEIQPFWAKLAVLPDDAEAALEFWMNDASSDIRLTDAAPRGKWNRLMNARILSFELPEEWGQKLTKSESKKQSKTNRKSVPRTQPTLSSEEIIAGRKQLNLSQRALADRIGKSQSWVRDVENGRLNVNSKDLAALLKVLEQFPTAMSNDS